MEDEEREREREVINISSAFQFNDERKHYENILQIIWSKPKEQ